jgi:arylsulfatase A-like enzyme
MIGQYIDKLAKTGQLENTIVVFSSDHGDMLGDLNRWGKNLPYHPSASVPLLVAGPGIPRGIVSPAVINSIDLTATFLDYADVRTMPDIDGRTFRPVLEGKTTQHREFAVSALGAWRMAYDGRCKVVRGFDPTRSNPAEWSPSTKEVQGLLPLAFDLAGDPKEVNAMRSVLPPAARRLLDVLPA